MTGHGRCRCVGGDFETGSAERAHGQVVDELLAASIDQVGHFDDHPPRALILESTFTSVSDVASEMWVPGFLIVDKFESLPAIRRYEGPLLLFRGTRDEGIPTAHGRRLAEAHGDARLILYDSGHNDLPPPGSDYWDQIERHLRESDVLD